jgi:hypothetical protein
MAHTNTTAKPPRLPAGFLINKYDFGLATTQQQAHTELLQDLTMTMTTTTTTSLGHKQYQYLKISLSKHFRL